MPVQIKPVNTIEVIVTVHLDVQPTGLPMVTVTKRVSLRLAKMIKVTAIRPSSFRKVRQEINFKLFYLTRI